MVVIDREFGSKIRSGGAASAQNEAIDRRERLRKLALETIDLSKDPYFMRNHLGSYECKLCLTLHTNEGSYLAHTQGKRHQTNLAKRAAREAKDAPIAPAPQKRSTIRKTVKIGRPGYRITKQFAHNSQQRSLLFQIEYPEIEGGTRPRHRFMSAYEQRVEPWDKKYQYILFAAEPYESIGFKVPNVEIDKGHGKFYAEWSEETKTYTLQLHFRTITKGAGGAPGAPPPGPPGSMPPPPSFAAGQAIPPPPPIPPANMPPPPPVGMPPPPPQ